MYSVFAFYFQLCYYVIITDWRTIKAINPLHTGANLGLRRSYILHSKGMHMFLVFLWKGIYAYYALQQIVKKNLSPLGIESWHLIRIQLYRVSCFPSLGIRNFYMCVFIYRDMTQNEFYTFNFLKISLTVGEEQISSIGRGICVLLGISVEDTQKELEHM